MSCLAFRAVAANRTGSSDTERGCDQSRQRGPEQTSAGRSRGETVDASQMQNRATVSGMIQQAVAAAAEKAEEVQSIIGAWSNDPSDLKAYSVNEALLSVSGQ